jgi:hypothetical protein
VVRGESSYLAFSLDSGLRKQLASPTKKYFGTVFIQIVSQIYLGGRPKLKNNITTGNLTSKGCFTLERID